MSRLEELPPDQRAALSLLLRQRKSHAQVATMLQIGEQAVHDRAHAALAVLAPRQARALEPAKRHEIGDYLLGQQTSIAERLRTRTLLSSSAAANEWAHMVAGELAGIGGVELPEIPPAPEPSASSAASPPAPAPVSQPAAKATIAPASASPTDKTQETPYSLAEAAASASPWEPTPTGQRSSKLGGALVLAAIVAAVVVVIVIASSGGSSHKKPQAGASTPTATTGPKEQAHFTLKAPGKSKSVGSVQILSEGTKRAFYIQAEHIPATKHFFYAIWLYNSHTSALPLSKSPPVGKSHKLAGAAALPENAGSYKEILLTRETSQHPTHPGHVVLRGPFTLTG
jgi:hypothetical protein